MDSGGTFPDDLVQTRAAWNAAYAVLAAPRPRDTTALRRRLLRPYGCGGTPTGGRHPRCRPRRELRRLARARQAVGAA
nr:hypothetical protein StreXyl84_65970 [Streptomyces sp. Xyl84]